jgi:hypothetical protein
VVLVNIWEFTVVDPNMKDFYGRLRRINKIHRAGGGFEATGTLGLAYYNSLQRRRSRHVWLMPVALVLVTVIVIKGAVLANVGEATYDSRIAALQAGDTADRIGAYVLQADPLTQYVATFIANF